MTELEQIRIIIPKELIKYKDYAGEFFDFYENSQNLTEEYLYTHQPLTLKAIKVYSTSPNHIGILDDCDEVREKFNIIEGPAIIVARKGYAGRMFVIRNELFIIHEDAYPIKPKESYQTFIDLDWFVGHYSKEFESYRTSPWGIGDFPRERFKKMKVEIPDLRFQKAAAILYSRRNNIIQNVKNFQFIINDKMDQLLAFSLSRRDTTTIAQGHV